MKSLIAGLLLSVPVLAQAYTWTDTDPSTPILVNTTTPYQYTFSLLDQGFTVGTDIISNYNVSIHLFDNSHSSWFDFNTAVLDQPGLVGDDLSVFWSDGSLGGSSYQGQVKLNQTGTLDVSVFSLAGSFFIDSASLTATGTKKSSNVPEPTSIALLAAGLLGIAVMRRKNA
ncbi:MAG: motif protein [Verrucomicrobiaceae bacterium]|nr:motif protein [Verrucomicrobiaceae bacterium]